VRLRRDTGHPRVRGRRRDPPCASQSASRPNHYPTEAPHRTGVGRWYHSSRSRRLTARHDRPHRGVERQCAIRPFARLGTVVRTRYALVRGPGRHRVQVESMRRRWDLGWPRRLECVGRPAVRTAESGVPFGTASALCLMDDAGGIRPAGWQGRRAAGFSAGGG